MKEKICQSIVAIEYLFSNKKSIVNQREVGTDSVSFEITDGLITQEEGLASADSANNLLWLLNNGQPQAGSKPEAPQKQKTTFTGFTFNA